MEMKATVHTRIRHVQTARRCYYADVMKCQPLNFKGTEGVVGLTRWIEKMDSVFNISGCAIENQVKFATYTLLGAALTWWIGQIRTLGPEAYTMTWEVLKKKMTDKYYPQGEIKKLEIELGLPDNIYGNVKSARPKTLDETIELANDLMDQKLRTYAEMQYDNKRKADDSSRNNHGHQQQPFKRQNVAKVYNMGTGERKPYGGSLPKCTKCHLQRNGPCTQRCYKCNKVGHFARDCRSTGNTNVANTQHSRERVVRVSFAPVLEIEVEVYVCQPPGFEDPDHPDKVYKADLLGSARNKLWLHIFLQLSAEICGLSAQIADTDRHLKLDDHDGITSIPNSEIFKQLALMGYHTDSDKLTFQKGAFSPQWRFLIHTILHCLSPKKTAWELFSSNIATAVICLATNRRFNFSSAAVTKLILRVKKLEAKVKARTARKGARVVLSKDDEDVEENLPTKCMKLSDAEVQGEKKHALKLNLLFKKSDSPLKSIKIKEAVRKGILKVSTAGATKGTASEF
ncbi:putative reverse transcriptase domain-containing protein [Tanacetum coccineum]|uniref:Reverse transcriptase domain-containing protein n=1 Tax=Tanacetum coccineum TaxID=301880 RepID=A0ABQ5E147_9ASTR